MDLAQLSGIALALALGLLVGVERGWAQREGKPGSRFAGIRTYGLFGLAGGVAGALFGESEMLAALILAATSGLILLSYWRITARGGSLSGTASVVGLLTMACGFLAAKGERLTATAIAVAMVLLLAMRHQLHRLIARLTEEEVLHIARFAAIAAVILPLLPDRAYGPLDAWNPRQLWLVVVLVSGFSFAGYFATKWLGPSRGTVATAAAGSMVSSTAVTMALAHRLSDEREAAGVLHGGIAVASATMFVRVLVLVSVLAPFALPTFAVLAAPGLAVSLAAAAWFLWRARRSDRPDAEAKPVDVRNPFDIAPALLLMALVMAMTLLARWVLARYGDTGLATVLAVSGTVDVDSAIITMGNLPAGSLTPRVAGLVLAPPVVLNTLLKAGVTVGVGSWRRGWPGAATLVASAVAPAAAIPLVW